MFWMVVLLTCSLSASVHAATTAPGQAVSKCKRSNYQDNNSECQPCPSPCKECASNTNCTECEDNYWGLTCQMKCSQHCPSRCHKKFGHCTYTCHDGTFGRPDSTMCTNCTATCEICSSASNCFLCKPRFYGPDCQNCPNTCIDRRCDMNTGECLECKDGYFSQDGICQKCSDSCVSCSDAGTCSECDNGFYGPYNGKCVRVPYAGDKRTYFEALIIVSSIGLIAICTSVILLIRSYKSRRSSARAVIHSTKTNDDHVATEHVTTEHVTTEHMTTDLEQGDIPRVTHPTLQQDAHVNIGTSECMSTRKSRPIIRSEEYTDESVMIPLRNLATVQHEERVSTDMTAGMTSRTNQPSVSLEEYMTLGVDVEVHNYESLGKRDSYVDFEPIQPTSESDDNSRAATGTSRDYITPV